MKTSKYKSLNSLMSILGAATIGKLLSMLARLLTVRTIKSEAMGIFSLINPLMVLLINLSQIGLPVAISTLIAKKPNDSRKILCNSLYNWNFAFNSYHVINLFLSTYFCKILP